MNDEQRAEVNAGVVGDALDGVVEKFVGLPGVRKITKRSPAPRAKEEDSPYFGVPVEKWHDRTGELVDQYPMPMEDLVDVVHRSWSAIFDSVLGAGFRIGEHIFPGPQIMGTLLHELIPLEIEAVDPGKWKAQQTVAEKDLVFLSDDRYSTEIKTSSHASRIFANRSYGQSATSEGKKAKSGYYLAVNFEGFPPGITRPAEHQIRPSLRMIRFGWLDHSDWLSQKSETGQAASLPALVENGQLLTFYKS